MHDELEWRKKSATDAISVNKKSFHTVMMQNKHDLPDKKIIMRVIRLVLLADDVAERKRILAVFGELHSFGKIACDFLSCDKDLISGNKPRFSLRQSPNDLVIISEHRENIISFKSGRQTYIGAK